MKKISQSTIISLFNPKGMLTQKNRTWNQYGSLIKHLNQLQDVKVIVLSGTGKHLSAGIDLKSSFKMFKETSQKTKAQTLEFLKKFQNDINIGVGSKIPIISVAHGVSFGLALDLISATSIRLASKDSRFSIKEIDIGIIADIGSLQRLPILSNNVSKIYEYALTGDEFNSQDAFDLGLVSNVFSSKEEALNRAFEIANKISLKYQPAVHGTKQNLDLVTSNSQIVSKGLEQVGIDNTNLMKDPKFSEFFVKSTKKLGSKL
ncbi:hypothetical protein BN7_4520 [Wickerhamomyces ciferrii]|uniref:Enoyl-CoA hydratase n=1 Tax=Wickerhamomyces ciferrii (strain ATCC 14091 / BCRC 22168 / CBS 111 / JCM 3599 / NBRC 0793 / NRRL Y-1031 F-60-10) TaxID=1206466 RepID=K0KUV8_WICCF|nr:uncharacterized protein BN7_4520 [Wickerhamomyces ciferrii]CCH44948.1 hypothetical protein BN7_4520 [Wickerhamomyces ciferrii]